MDKILENSTYRRYFYFLSFALIMLLVTCRALLSTSYCQISNNASHCPPFVEILIPLLDRLVASFFVTVAIGSFLFYVTPNVIKKSAIEILSVDSIGESLEKAMTSTDSWWYKGACGRYLRSKTLPTLFDSVVKSGSYKSVALMVLDPTNDDLCSQYSNYRNGLKSAAEDPWSPERVKKELYATILVIFVQRSKRNALLAIELYLTNHFSAFRFDMSHDYVVITTEERTAPAIRCDRDTHFYKAYQNEMAITRQHSKIIKFEPMSLLDLKITTGDDVKQIMKQADLESSLLDSPAMCSDILELARKSKSPYG